MHARAQVIQLTYSRESAKQLVKLALEYTGIIKSYSVTSRQIAAKTGLSFPRVLWSWGERLYIDFNESRSRGITELSVHGEKVVPINIGGNPEMVKRRFLARLDQFRGLSRRDIDKRLAELTTKANGRRATHSESGEQPRESATPTTGENQPRRQDTQKTRASGEPTQDDTSMIPEDIWIILSGILLFALVWFTYALLATI